MEKALFTHRISKLYLMGTSGTADIVEDVSKKPAWPYCTVYFVGHM